MKIFRTPNQGQLNSADRDQFYFGEATKAYLYMASCSGLEAWASQLGICARHIGFACDPHERIKAMRMTQYAGAAFRMTQGGLFIEEPGWDDWNLLPMAAEGKTDIAYPLHAGMLQVPLFDRSIDIVSRRLLVMLTPLEASRCAMFQSAITARSSQRSGVFKPRYMLAERGHYAVVRDIYRFNDQLTGLLSAAIYGVLLADYDASSAISVALDNAVNSGENISVLDLWS